jgi:hypothetical protein
MRPNFPLSCTHRHVHCYRCPLCATMSASSAHVPKSYPSPYSLCVRVIFVMRQRHFRNASASFKLNMRRCHFRHALASYSSCVGVTACSLTYGVIVVTLCRGPASVRSLMVQSSVAFWHHIILGTSLRAYLHLLRSSLLVQSLYLRSFYTRSTMADVYTSRHSTNASNPYPISSLTINMRL